MKVHFDASVIIAALLSSTGGSALLLQFVKDGLIIGIVSQNALDEVMEEDKAKRVKRSRREIERFIAETGVIVMGTIAEEEIAPYHGQVDSEDAYLITGANLTGCTYLVTLDKKHLLRPDIREKFLPLCIVSPKEMLEEIRSHLLS